MAPIMAPTLLPRVDTTSTSRSPMSTTVIIGIVVIAIAAVALGIALAVIYLRKSRRAALVVKPGEPTMKIQSSVEKGSLSPDQQALRFPVSFANVSPRDPSVIFPIPVPPAPVALPRPPKQNPPTNRPLSEAEVLAHHVATGTTPRAFTPIPVSALPSISASGTSSARPFSFALNPSSVQHSFDRLASPAAGTPNTRPGSIASFSRRSVLATSIRHSTLRDSLTSLSSSGTTGAEQLKVRNVFAPLLPDELVLRRGEHVALVQAYDDGWYIVGRRAAWTSKHDGSSGKGRYMFGHSTAHSAPDEVELGAVPAWVFHKSTGPHERPMRGESLGVTLVLQENERVGARSDIVSWSNFS